MCILLCSSLQAEPAKTAAIKLTFQEAQIVSQLLQQVELGTHEVDPYLEIYSTLELLIDSPQMPDEEVLLNLPERGVRNLLLFLERANIPAMGAKQISKILQKVQKSLSKDIRPAKKPKGAPKRVVLPLTNLEAQFIQKMLDQIELSISEIKTFLALYTPLEQASNTGQDAAKEIMIKLPATGPQNLLLFLQRTTLAGSQAKIIHTILEKVQRSITTPE